MLFTKLEEKVPERLQGELIFRNWWGRDIKLSVVQEWGSRRCGYNGNWIKIFGIKVFGLRRGLKMEF